MNPLGSELGHGGLSTQLKLSLLSVVRSSSTGSGALVPRISCNTHSRWLVGRPSWWYGSKSILPAPVFPLILRLFLLLRSFRLNIPVLLLLYAPPD